MAAGGQPLYASSYGVYILLIFIALFLIFLVLYLNERDKNQPVVVRTKPLGAREAAVTTTPSPLTTVQLQHVPQPARALGAASTAPTTAATPAVKGLVTVDLMGGLGNQLFQIAAAYAYAQDFNKTLVMDHSPTRVGSRKAYFDSVFSWTEEHRDMKRKNWRKLKEAAFHYNPLPDQFGNVKLHGYFQSLKYFEAYSHDIVTLFKEHTPPIPESHVTWQELQQATTPTVSLHIRRSDYVGSSMHPIQPMNYYRGALDLLKRELQVPELTILVFSDDIPWCKVHVPQALTGVNILYVDSRGLLDAQELVLMSECDHHVIANSSFSWWGAMYNQKPDKLVVAPKLWFGKTNYNWQDVYAPGWLVI